MIELYFASHRKLTTQLLLEHVASGLNLNFFELPKSTLLILIDLMPVLANYKHFLIISSEQTKLNPKIT